MIIYDTNQKGALTSLPDLTLCCVSEQRISLSEEKMQPIIFCGECFCEAYQSGEEEMIVFSHHSHGRELQGEYIIVNVGNLMPNHSYLKALFKPRTSPPYISGFFRIIISFY